MSQRHIGKPRNSQRPLHAMNCSDVRKCHLRLEKARHKLASFIIVFLLEVLKEFDKIVVTTCLVSRREKSRPFPISNWRTRTKRLQECSAKVSLMSSDDCRTLRDSFLGKWDVIMKN